MALTIESAVKPGDPAEGGEPRELAQVNIGDVVVTVYESLLDAGHVVIDVDRPDNGTNLRVALNDQYVYDSTGVWA